ncbi:hypothetical protein [Streptomyces hydrogenans]|uniref:hypothetical protein n=1 Tax=Streptomyces hydrogenans TaxID=1873719 RepID=UPI0038245E46
MSGFFKGYFDKGTPSKPAKAKVTRERTTALRREAKRASSRVGILRGLGKTST